MSFYEVVIATLKRENAELLAHAIALASDLEGYAEEYEKYYPDSFESLNAWMEYRCG